jgi:hypothetical protein
MTVSTQAAQTMVKFFEDFGTAPNVVKSVARRMKIAESAVQDAATAFVSARRTVSETHGDAAHARQIRESAARMAVQAKRAESDLRHARTGELAGARGDEVRRALVKTEGLRFSRRWPLSVARCCELSCGGCGHHRGNLSACRSRPAGVVPSMEYCRCFRWLQKEPHPNSRLPVSLHTLPEPV